MTKQTSPKAVWIKPELVRLGKIADVAGPKAINSNGSSSGFADS